MERLIQIKQQLRAHILPDECDVNFNAIHGVRMKLHKERSLLMRSIDKMPKGV